MTSRDKRTRRTQHLEEAAWRQSDFASSTLRSLLSDQAVLVLNLARSEGPKCVRDLDIRLKIDDADLICTILRREGMQVQPYDFPNTFGVWKSKDEHGVYYPLVAIKEMILALGKQEKSPVDVFTLEGFKAILPKLSAKTFLKFKFNEWGTTAAGAIDKGFDGSPSKAVLTLVDEDADFKVIKKAGLKTYDFPAVPKSYWTEGDQITEAGVTKSIRRPLPICRELSKLMIQALAQYHEVDYRTVAGFKELLPHFTKPSIAKVPINIFGTTCRVMLNIAYNGSPSRAILDVVAHDPELQAIRAADLRATDFPERPKESWTSGKERLTSNVRDAVKTALKAKARELGVNVTTKEGFREVLPFLDSVFLETYPINVWGTTLGGILSAYEYKPSEAFLDVINNDPIFQRVRRVELHGYDFPRAPANTWVTKEGKPTPLARECTKQLLRVLGRRWKVDFLTAEGLMEIQGRLDQNTFQRTPINYWGTTLDGMVMAAYGNLHSMAITDLVAHDPEFLSLNP